ncbi:MAG: hypothetical protein WA691_02490 [Thermoplasmata archaeon]
MTPGSSPSDEEQLLEGLRLAVSQSTGRPREIEVGIALSIALGRRRPSVACGGCKNPLDFEGIPARTNARLREPFRLIFDEPTHS